MPLSGKKVAVLAENLYQEMELWYPVYRFREAGATVHIIGTGTADTYSSKSGYPAKVDFSSDDVSADDYDAVIIPGGYAPDMMRRKASMVEFVQKANEQGKIVAAICHAGWMLCSADIVRGKTATCYFSIKDDLLNAGANYVDEEVAVDGNLITSRKPDDLPAFCREVIRALAPVTAG